ncbi:Hexosyltransferase [Sarracenia purpurea var. burkii]
MNPNAIEIGGIHIEKENPLPKDIEKFIEESVNGVVLFSLGSMIKGCSLSYTAQLAFKQAFAEIPQRVIWKYEEKMDNVPSNVMLSQWIPQRDILGRLYFILILAAGLL